MSILDSYILSYFFYFSLDFEEGRLDLFAVGSYKSYSYFFYSFLEVPLLGFRTTSGIYY